MKIENLLELLQKPHISSIQQSDIIDIILKHGEPGQAEAESEALVYFRIHPAGAQDVRMDHA